MEDAKRLEAIMEALDGRVLVTREEVELILDSGYLTFEDFINEVKADLPLHEASCKDPK